MQTTQVKLRDTQELIKVTINPKNTELITTEVKTLWQKNINTITEFLNVKAGLIMEITPEAMQVFLMSENKDNPYKVGGNDYLCHGLYCETVIGKNKELHIENALNNQHWKDNPDIALNMTSYYGLPISWKKDNTFFGTICILDDKPILLNQNQKEIIKCFRDSMEKDLLLIS